MMLTGTLMIGLGMGIMWLAIKTHTLTGLEHHPELEAKWSFTRGLTCVMVGVGVMVLGEQYHGILMAIMTTVALVVMVSTRREQTTV